MMIRNMLLIIRFMWKKAKKSKPISKLIGATSNFRPMNFPLQPIIFLFASISRAIYTVRINLSFLTFRWIPSVYKDYRMKNSIQKSHESNFNLSHVAFFFCRACVPIPSIFSMQLIIWTHFLEATVIRYERSNVSSLNDLNFFNALSKPLQINFNTKA